MDVAEELIGKISGLKRIKTPTPMGLYLHVPFCSARCGYCDFNTYTPNQAGASIVDYLEALHREIDLAAKISDRPACSTVFFGGGTPTMLSTNQLAGLLSHLKEDFEISPEAEITTEANPETLTVPVLEALVGAGFNRISIGMQSAVTTVLATLNRLHTPGQAVEMAKAARMAGFRQVSLDLIYGTPGETTADWQHSLEQALSAEPDHLSCYSLIVEEGTALARMIKKGELASPDEDDLADKYQLADNFLESQGFENYEVSNWALPEARCQHNLHYWLSNNWWGFGPGAHSHFDGLRWWNEKHPRTYVAKLAQEQLAVQGFEEITPQERHEEKLLLQLRLIEGIELAELSQTEIDRLSSARLTELIEVSEHRVRLSKRGKLLADYVVRTILD